MKCFFCKGAGCFGAFHFALRFDERIEGLCLGIALSLPATPSISAGLTAGGPCVFCTCSIAVLER